MTYLTDNKDDIRRGANKKTKRFMGHIKENEKKKISAINLRRITAIGRAIT